MRRIRLLIVDDAVVIRRLVSEVLSTDPEIEIVGTAANGRIALQKISQCTPDVVTMDVEMPDMDGLETLRELRKQWPALPVIMFSTLTERGAATTLDALALGASDYVTKPANVGSVTAGVQAIRETLIPKIKALAGRAPAAACAAPASRPVVPAVPAAAPREAEAEIVAIGVSTGGPNALAALLPALPADLAAPVVIVQHMPPTFTRLLADRLHAQSKLSVREATAGMPLEAGCAYIAPGDQHMVVRREGIRVVLDLNQDPPENSCRPAVDPLFRSVAAQYGRATLAVVLTGMGQDGLRGCERIRDAGGQVIVQDEATSVVWGMPGFVARAGLADRIVPISFMARDIVQRVKPARALASLGRTPVLRA